MVEDEERDQNVSLKVDQADHVCHDVFEADGEPAGLQSDSCNICNNITGKC